MCVFIQNIHLYKDTTRIGLRLNLLVWSHLITVYACSDCYLNNNIDKDISNLILGATLKMRRNPACDQDSGNGQASGCGALIAVEKPMDANIVSSPQNSAAVLYWCLWHKFTIMLE